MEIRGFRLLGLLLVVLIASAAGQTARGRAIVIKTEPKAIVWLNGIRYGTTDDRGQLDLKSAPPGRQLVRIRADGFKEASKAILPTQSGSIEIPLTKTTDEAELAFQEAEKLSTVDRKRSEAAYRNAIKAKPGFVDAYIGLARVLSEAGDLEEGLRAAAAVGDDTLQKQTRGRVVPDSFTHGSAAERQHWLQQGYSTGDPKACNTFGNAR